MKKRILLISASARKGTISSLAFNLYKALIAFGYEVFVVVVNSTDADFFVFENSLLLPDTSKLPIFRKLPAYLQKRKKIQEFKKKNAIDVTIATEYVSIFLGVLSRGKDKVVGIFHRQLWRPLQEPVFSKTFLVMLFAKYLVFPHLDRLCPVSRTVETSLRKSYPYWIRRKIHLAYNIFNVEDISRKAKEEISTAHKKIFNRDVLLYVGRIDYNKNPMRLLRAYGRLPDTLKAKTNLVFVGSDLFGDYPALLEVIKDYNLEENVFYLGEVQNPYPLMRRAKVLISSSLSEGLPSVLVESLLLNTPVISTNSTEGVWEILSCEQDYDVALCRNYFASNGIITPNLAGIFSTQDSIEKDVSFLADAVNCIFSDETLYQKMKESRFLFSQKILPSRIIEVLTSV